MDKDKAKVELKEAIIKALERGELDNREFLIGEDTINYMTDAALNVLLAVKEIQNYLEKEEIINYQ